MKSIIITLLSSGFTKTKKDFSELTAYCYFLKEIAEIDTNSNLIRCKSNKFWDSENNKNRNDLINDVYRTQGKGVRNWFSIFNRYENGDSYGIER